MELSKFIGGFQNHPVLFIGTGISLRYLKQSYTWDGLLSKVSSDFSENEEYYLDLKSRCETDGKYDFPKIATLLEQDFNKSLSENRNGKFKSINDIFYSEMKNNNNLSRLKIYLTQLLSNQEIKEEMKDEISEFTKARKNIGSVITTNYDQLVENLFQFTPLIGNNILLSNPYGAVYKIHGCISAPERIIITERDYEKFSKKYELVRAQLLSLFIHNPIIFMGYGIGDENIKSILKTVFTYVQPNSEQAEKIRKNFLLVEHDKDSESKEITEHDIDLAGFATIRINKIKTNDFKSIYSALANLKLPVSAMDVRKVQDIVREISAGGEIKVSITEDLDSIKNGDKIIAIGSSKTISYQHYNTNELMSNYFKIIDESNSQMISVINKLTIQTSQWFPSFGFSSISDEVTEIEKLKSNQRNKINKAIDKVHITSKSNHNCIPDIFADDAISRSNKFETVLWGLFHKKISLVEIEEYLRKFEDKESTNYRRLLCMFDYLKYS
jgi:hypothetical protein